VIRGGNLTQQPPTRLGRDLSLELRFRDRLEVRAAANELLLDVDVRDSALAIKRLEVGLNITWRRLVRLSIPHHPATVRWWTHYRPLACRGCQSQQLLSTESLIRLCAESGPRHSLPVQQVTVLGHGRKDSLSALAILGRKRQGGQAGDLVLLDSLVDDLLDARHVGRLGGVRGTQLGELQGVTGEGDLRSGQVG
jgi:hypothetical protein